MATIAGQRVLYTTLRQMQQDMAGLFGRLAQQASIQVLTAASADGSLSEAQGRRVRARIGQIINNMFVGGDGISPFADDGVTPLAAYPRLLNGYLATVIIEVVDKHAAYMARVTPPDVQDMLAIAAKRRDVSEMRVSEQGRDGFYENLRIFQPNPLAFYDAPHIWIDPNGYRLSDRIWRSGQETRLKLDRILSQSLNEGRGALEIANLIEDLLVPSRRRITTTKPYGERYQGRVAYDAMRLARSEIARAHGQAAKAASVANPYVEFIDWRLSAMHPRVDICDIIAGEGPYPVGSAPVPVQDSHPQCMCALVPQTHRAPSSVTAELRAALQEAEAEFLRPVLTPLQTQQFKAWLLGEAFEQLISNLGRVA